MSGLDVSESYFDGPGVPLSVHTVFRRVVLIGVGDGIREKIFFGQNHAKFGHFVNFSCTYFRAKMSCPPKLTELLRLWLC